MIEKNLNIVKYKTRSGSDIYEGCIRGYVLLYTYKGGPMQMRTEEGKFMRCRND